ncbi:MAG: DJ-1/PfpI family protein [bacterium]|nr:DJ-1/PfpI family protein [bacterium]
MKALFILPHYDFDDDEYFQTKEALEAAGIRTEVCSTHLSEAQGRFKKIVKPDFLVDDVESEDFDAFVFVGGNGATELYHNIDIQNLVNDILLDHKVIALIGEAVPILYYANVIKGRNVTTLENLRQEVEAGGAYYTGMGMEQDGDLITGFDNRSSKDISDAVIRALDWEKEHEKSSEIVRG